MTVKKLVERCQAIGLPFTKNYFAGTIDEPVPDLPYMVYLIPHEKGRGADTKNNLKEIDFDLELYTANDDQEREDLANKIKETVLFDVEYEEYVAPIADEDSYQTAYEVHGLITKAKGEK